MVKHHPVSRRDTVPHHILGDQSISSNINLPDPIFIVRELDVNLTEARHIDSCIELYSRQNTNCSSYIFTQIVYNESGTISVLKRTIDFEGYKDNKTSIAVELWIRHSKDYAHRLHFIVFCCRLGFCFTSRLPFMRLTQCQAAPQ